MALFVVMAFSDTVTQVAAKVQQKFPNDFYQIEPGKWFVSSALVTAKQVSDDLEITVPDDTNATTRGVVVAVRGYYGRGPRDMWEWVAAKEKGSA